MFETKRKGVFRENFCNRIFLFSFIFLLTLTSIQCTKIKTDPQEFPEMKFNVDENLLGKEITNHEFGFTFKAPVSWKETKEIELQDITNKLTKVLSGKKNFSVKPLYIFVRNDGCVLNVAELSLQQVSNDFDDNIKLYEDIFLANHDSLNIKKAKYSKNGLRIAQYLLQDNRIDFRLLFQDKKKNLIQFDYISERKNYLNEIKAIESSIGSINLL